MISVFYTRFDTEFSSEKWESHCRLLPSTMVEGILRYKKWEDRHRVLLGKFLLLHALQENGFDAGYLNQLKLSEHKRPYLDIPLDFNISHSGNMILCAVSDSGRVGIDIEEIKAIDFKSFEKIMSEDEWADIYASQNPLASFYKYWSIKESVIKADGRGLYLPLDYLNPINQRVILGNTNWHISELKPDENYATWLAFDEEQEIRLEKINH